MSAQNDPFMATFKSITARLGITVHYKTDAFGRTQPCLDRAGMLELREAAANLGFPELAEGIERMLAGGRP
ncbi:hypothetical protein [Streptomyces halstedii]|uniref:hypothetical protein n=1 Tax=Streptomyces halstedii TaxID=1944 RepID=UPI0038273B4D